MKSDIEIIEERIRNRGSDGVVKLGKREADDGRDFWLIDRAILLPAHTTLILDDCTVKLSDKSRDNFIRTANCGVGIENPLRISDVHVKGIGGAALVGADHPRATGDESKTLARPCPFNEEDLLRLAPWVSEEERKNGKTDFWTRHMHTYGTDADRPDAQKTGGWQNIGVLFARVDGFSIENLSIVESHAWAISIEDGTHGIIRGISFDARMNKTVDGMLQNIENQDGIDLRNGCADIEISDITGGTGDDVIALTAIAVPDEQRRPSGDPTNTHVLASDWEHRETGIHRVTIRNVKAHSTICWVLRLLACKTVISDVTIENITDTNPETHRSAILVGEAPDSMYGEVIPDSLRNIRISGVYGNCTYPVDVQGYLTDSVIENVHSNAKDSEPVFFEKRERAVNVTVR